MHQCLKGSFLIQVQLYYLLLSTSSNNGHGKSSLMILITGIISKLYFVHSQPEPEPEPEPEQEEPQDLYENVETPSETQPGFQTYDTAEGQIQEEPAQKEPEQLAEATGYDEEEQLYDNAEPVQVMYDP